MSKKINRLLGWRIVTIIICILLVATSITITAMSNKQPGPLAKSTSFIQTDPLSETTFYKIDHKQTTKSFGEEKSLEKESSTPVSEDPVEITIENIGETIRITYHINRFSWNKIKIRDTEYMRYF